MSTKSTPGILRSTAVSLDALNNSLNLSDVYNGMSIIVNVFHHILDNQPLEIGLLMFSKGTNVSDMIT